MEYIKEPRRKRNVFVRREQPFPIVIESFSGIPVSDRLWQTYTGRYNGDCVIVEKESEIHALFRKGYFGKPSLSRNFPSFGKFRNGIPPFISERQWKCRSQWKEALNSKRVQNTLSDCVKLEPSEAGSPHKETDVDPSSLPLGVNSLSREAGPQAFPPDWEDRQRDTVPTQVVNTLYRPPTIKFRRDPRNRKCASVLSVLETANSGLLSSVSVCGTTNPDRPTVNDGSSPSFQNCSTLNVNTNNLTESRKHRNEREEMQQCESGSEDRVNSEKQNRILHCAASDEVVVLCDSDSEDEELRVEKLEAKLVKDPYQLHEHLHLTLEEAFFLSYALGCLQVLDLLGKPMTLKEVWETFRKSDEQFVQKYVTYHHFRSKGWIVKPGIKYGGDFLLYKEGPPFYHASYIVMVAVLSEDDWSWSLPHNYRTISWSSMFGANRLAETVGKEILVCRVIWPASVSPSGPRTPHQLARFCVEEILLRRWVSSQEREELDDEDIIE